LEIAMSSSGNWIRVWDPIVRIGHWALVAAFFTAYFTKDDFLSAHVWAGYTVAGVVGLRLVWGLVGPRHARFSDFVRSPPVVLRYVRDTFGRRADRYLGHNPAGGIMVVALLTCLAITATAGFVVYAYEEGAGPLAPMLAGHAAAESPDRAAFRTMARYDEPRSREHEAEEQWEEVHEVFANLTLLLVLLHVGGVALSSLAHRENLVGAMITGRKRADP
jgi:cytochrome b